FGKAMAGMSASSTGRNSSSWSVWPFPAFYLLTAVAPFVKGRKQRIRLLCVAWGALIVTSCASSGVSDGLVLVALASVTSLLAWGPLLVKWRDDAADAGVNS